MQKMRTFIEKSMKVDQNGHISAQLSTIVPKYNFMFLFFSYLIELHNIDINIL